MKWILILAALQPLPPLDQEPTQPVEYPTHAEFRAAAVAIQTTSMRAHQGVQMTKDDIIRMAREAGFEELFKDSHDWVCFTEEIERFAALVAAAAKAEEREAFAEKTGEFARKWWSIHCASNKHMETTRKAHDDFCALQAAIRARGQA